MSHIPRSQYELGDDPLTADLKRAERTDHHHAFARAQRLLLIADSVISVLEAGRALHEPAAARRDIFGVLAEALCANQAIEVPDFMNARSLEALRRGQEPLR